MMQKVTPFLWFDHQADEAAKSYASIFKNSKEFFAAAKKWTNPAIQKCGRLITVNARGKLCEK